jgi:hypothetical protein
LDGAKVTIRPQLLRSGPPPIFGPLKKNWNRRTINIGPKTVTLLREHRRAQRELMMANRKTFRDDLDLVFSKTYRELTGKPGDALGLPLAVEHLSGP